MKSILLGLAAAALIPIVSKGAESSPDRNIDPVQPYTVFAPERLRLDSTPWQSGSEKMRMNLFIRNPDLQVTAEEVREMMGLPPLTIPELALRNARTTEQKLNVLRLIAKLEAAPPRTTAERLSLVRLMTRAATGPFSNEVIIKALGEPDATGPRGALVYFDAPGIDVIQRSLTEPLSQKPGLDMVVVWVKGTAMEMVQISIPADRPMVYAPPWENLGMVLR